MKIERAREVEPRLRAALAKAGRREIGGMLMGEQLAPDHFRIADLSLDAFSSSHTHFRRDPRMHQKTLDEFFQRTGHDFKRFNYLGEWHSHPSFSVHPSLEDIETMTEMVDNGKCGGRSWTRAKLLSAWCRSDTELADGPRCIGQSGGYAPSARWRR